jgi:tripeptide aminopeptidase
VIQGGNAINIVPSLVTVKGEVRSHDKSKLDMVTNTVVSSFEDVVNNYINKDIDNNLPRIEVSIEKEFPNTNISEDHPAVILAQKAAKNLGRNMRTKITGGGADANIFFEKGIVTGVLGTGMRDMHTVRESVDIEDMVRATELLIEIIKLHSNAF